MVFYLTIKTDKPLTHVPYIDAIDITLNGKEKYCSWDETNASLEGYYVDYRFKGIAYATDNDEVYANNTIKKDSIVTISKDFWWMEDDKEEEFNFEIVGFYIMDYDENSDEWVKLAVIERQIGFVDNTELKKGDKIEYQIRKLNGKDYTPPIVHKGIVVTPVYSNNPYWITQIIPEQVNEQMPEYFFNSRVMAIYGEDILRII